MIDTSFDLAPGEEQLQYFLTEVASITNKPARLALKAARDQVRERIDFSTLYLKTKSLSLVPFALRPISLTEEEATELEEIRKRPSPLEGRRLRGIPNV